MPAEETHVHISRANTKLGKDIPSVNLPVCMSCREDAPCFDKCYGRKGRFRFANVRDTLAQNWQVWSTSPARFAQEVYMAAYYSRFFRWHSVGDIPSHEYLEMMVRVALALPNTSFLCFTKRYEIVNTYIDAHGDLPKNLHIVLSAWGDWMPANPHNLPMAFIRFKGGASQRIPEDAWECPKFCGDCVAGDRSCWSLGKGEAVVFNEH